MAGAGGPESKNPRLAGEENAAQRLKMERESRGWSTAEVARRMSEAGFPINQSSVWRIESGEPPRRINLDEAIGFAKIFGITLTELTGPSGGAVSAKMLHLFEVFQEAANAAQDALDAMDAAESALYVYADQHPDAYEAIDEYTISISIARQEGRLPPQASERRDW
ncbi:helix-turn-helix domain-containing protein [Kitasatospora sp. GAS1066B]|uniref:helix-turn-helix domain-containing protein n=1 Tax=Kitasatospora sp. GAS1066B TaxID=3156271 RepID=UPI003514F34D